VTDLAAFLRGEWDVERTVADERAGSSGGFEGVARFVARPGGGLAWHESGRLRLDGHEGPARRELAVVPADGGAWEVRFADGRPFHALDLRRGACPVAHDCAPDRYEGEVRVLGEAAFAVTWDVRGPGKAQRIESRYTRLGRAAGG
jgi:hypothetical protein